MKKRTLNFLIAFFLLLALIGLGMIFYPTLEGLIQSKVITEDLEQWNQLQDTIQQMPPEEATGSAEEQKEYVPDIMPELYLAMKAYNLHIFDTRQADFDSAAAYMESSIDITAYGMEEGPIGKVLIPKINIEMVLYLGATNENLSKGLAQMGQTSMPVGGKNTNCVISGHRGWRGAAYLRDINLLEPGDSVFVETLWGTLEYRVTDYIIIEPHEVECLLIQPGKDMVTLLTCEPYGVGTHRYLVFCERYIEGGT